MVDEKADLRGELVQIIRLGVEEKIDDFRLYAARLARRYRSEDPELAKKIEALLQNRAQSMRNIYRDGRLEPAQGGSVGLPADSDSRMSLLKSFNILEKTPRPILGFSLEKKINQLILEHQNSSILEQKGLRPSRTAIFVGPPGVGKTITAKWLAEVLEIPFYILDLTAVMSSLLGKSGSNIRAALDFAKESPCVLLLDEIDSIAKRRNDDSDIGELKRLVGVILQEVDNWPNTGLLLAATNHPEIVDPAIWRRFDETLQFDPPDSASIQEAIVRFLGDDYELFQKWVPALLIAMNGKTFSDIERSLTKMRRMHAIGEHLEIELLRDLLNDGNGLLGRTERIQLAVNLQQLNLLSQHTISDLTGVSRDTLRKYAQSSKKTNQPRKMSIRSTKA